MPVNAKTFVLIPGAWHGGWVWRPVAKRLRATGHEAVALTMPGLADGDDPTGLVLADAVDRIVSEVVSRNLSDVVLVAHSWGGYPMTGAAFALKERLSQVVYYNAYVPRPGRSVLDDLPEERAAVARAAIGASPTGSWEIGFDFVSRVLMPGEPEPLQRLLAELLVPHPGRYGSDPSTVPEVTTLGVPASYVLSEHDSAVAGGAKFAERVGVEPVIVPGTHQSLLTHPDAVAAALLQVSAEDV
jgi:pimeloyl-ACP methyl ester carboxylesterase